MTASKPYTLGISALLADGELIGWIRKCDCCDAWHVTGRTESSFSSATDAADAIHTMWQHPKETQ